MKNRNEEYGIKFYFSNLATAFGQAVRDRRRKLGLSQEELAWRAGLNRSYVTDVERGARNPSLATIDRLSQALQTPLSTLLHDVHLARGPLPREQAGECRAGKGMNRGSGAKG